MEFRLFFPLLLETDTWIKTARRNQYAATIESLLRSLDSRVSSYPERREDIYLITRPCYGVKYRAGKKSEIKIRTNIFEPNVEQWEKLKLGKREISHYQAEILQILGHKGLLAPGDAELLSAHKTIGVQKLRRMELIDGIGFTREICRITTSASDRHWLSIALEGSVAEVVAYLRSSSSVPEIHLILATLRIAVDIAKTDVTSALSSSFFPVAGGFPTWTPIAAMIAKEDDAQGVLTTAESLLASVGFK